MIDKLKQHIGRLKDESGAVAMEFALIMPVVIAFYFGGVSVYDAMRASHQAATVAVTLADLSTRAIDMNDDKRDALFNSGRALMSKWPSDTDFTISVTSVINPSEANNADPDVIQEVVWSEATDDSAKLTNADLARFDLPTIAEGDSLVIVEVTGTYRPQHSILGAQGNYDIQRNSVRRPRFVSEIHYISGDD